MGILLLLILEALLILDIGTTEYAISKKLGVELNPLMRNNRFRWCSYPIKLFIPLILEWANRLLNKQAPHLLYIPIAAFIGLISWGTFVGIKNLRIIFSQKKLKKREIK